MCFVKKKKKVSNMCSVISGSLEVEPKVEILVEVVW